jgi:hypothetical protein
VEADIHVPHERVERGGADPALKLIYDNYVESQLRADAGLQDRRGVFSYKLGFELDHEFSDRAEAVAFLASKGTSTCCPWARADDPKAASETPEHLRLLQVSSNTLGIPRNSMSIAQQLYQAGLITYMRTENQKYSRPFCAPLNVHRGSSPSGMSAT